MKYHKMYLLLWLQEIRSMELLASGSKRNHGRLFFNTKIFQYD